MRPSEGRLRAMARLMLRSFAEDPEWGDLLMRRVEALPEPDRSRLRSAVGELLRALERGEIPDPLSFKAKTAYRHTAPWAGDRRLGQGPFPRFPPRRHHETQDFQPLPL